MQRIEFTKKKGTKQMNKEKDSMDGAVNMMNGNLSHVQQSKDIRQLPNIMKMHQRMQPLSIMQWMIIVTSYITLKREKFGLYLEEIILQTKLAFLITLMNLAEKVDLKNFLKS